MNYTPKYTAEVAANWLKMKRTTVFYRQMRKSVTRDGWVMVADWCIYGADGKWHRIDTDLFFEHLGKRIADIDSNRIMRFDERLRKCGFRRVHDEGGAVCVIFSERRAK